MAVRVQHEDFDLSTEVARLRAGHADAGAVVAFVGTVRELGGAGSPAIASLELEHYPGMTEASLEDIAAQASRRWPLIDILVVHRVGMLRASDQIVLVAVVTRHRGDAFAACEFVMDYLKTEAPFWKKEAGDQGSRWVDARASDDAARARWDAHGDAPAQPHHDERAAAPC